MVKAISFVGSTPVAKAIYEAGTRNGKRVQSLGGAKNHMVVLPDADVGMAADAAVSAAFGSAGERCMSISVVIAVSDAADPLIDAVKERMSRITIGPGSESGNEMGPLITKEHRDRVASYLDSAKHQGASVEVDGREHPASSRAGFFLGASLIDRVKPGMSCYEDEILGRFSTSCASTLTKRRSRDQRESVCQRDRDLHAHGGAARQFQFDVEVGMVGVNVPVPVPVAYYSFGGWKPRCSATCTCTDRKAFSSTRGQTVTCRWPDSGTSSVNLGFPQVR